jgi:AraC-like DNA-binding protein
MAISFDRVRRLEPSAVARRLLWHVLSVGEVSRDEAEHHDAFDKPGAYFFRVVSGRGTLRSGRREWALSPGKRCWLLDLQRPRAYLPEPGATLVTQGVRFAGPGVESWLESLATEEPFLLTAQQGAAVRQIHRHLVALVTRQPRQFEWQVHILVLQILGLLLSVRGLLAPRPATPPPAVSRVLDAVAAKPEHRWQARELVRRSGVGYSSLRAAFKQAQGATLKEFLTRTRLDAARLRLGDPRLTIKEVARTLDFSSEHYFSHFFRRHTGLTPSQYRNRGAAQRS